MNRCYKAIVTISFFLIPAIYGFTLPSVTELIRKIDELQDGISDISAKTTFIREKAGQGKKVYEALYYRRDRDDSFLVIIISPDSEKGNGYLRIKDNFWMYLVNTRTFQHVNRDESIAGTDAKGGDFEKNKIMELYKPKLNENGKELIGEEILGKIPVYRFELTAKVIDVAYPKKIYWIRKDNCLPLKVEAYSLSDTLMQTAYYLKYAVEYGKYIVIKQMFIDEFEKGNKTILEINSISFNKIDDSVFTKGYLENLSK